MASLPELQRKLKRVFTHPRGVTAGLAAAGFDGRSRPVTALVADRPPVPLHTRLAVYSDAYFLRILESLGQDFAAVRRALGAEGFQRAVADFLVRHPSRSPFINAIGAAFPGFLKKHPASKKSPFLAELAALEWAALKALFTDRLPPADPRAFAALHAGARLRLDPTVALLPVRWAVDRLWENRGLPAGTGPRRAGAPAARRLLLYRDDAWVKVEALPPAEFTVLRRLAAGQPLGRALGGLGKSVTTPVIQAWFSRWTRSGIVKGILDGKTSPK